MYEAVSVRAACVTDGRMPVSSGLLAFITGSLKSPRGFQGWFDSYLAGPFSWFQMPSQWPGPVPGASASGLYIMPSGRWGRVGGTCPTLSPSPGPRFTLVRPASSPANLIAHVGHQGQAPGGLLRAIGLQALNRSDRRTHGFCHLC